MLCATVVATGHALALPLMPQFIAPKDGAEKQDCERSAVKRWLARHADRVRELRPVFPGDDLFACQPVVDAMVAAGGDFLLTAKPISHNCLIAERCWDRVRWAIEEHAWRFEQSECLASGETA